MQPHPWPPESARSGVSSWPLTDVSTDIDFDEHPQAGESQAGSARSDGHGELVIRLPFTKDIFELSVRGGVAWIAVPSGASLEVRARMRQTPERMGLDLVAIRALDSADRTVPMTVTNPTTAFNPPTGRFAWTRAWLWDRLVHIAISKIEIGSDGRSSMKAALRTPFGLADRELTEEESRCESETCDDLVGRVRALLSSVGSTTRAGAFELSASATSAPFEVEVSPIFLAFPQGPLHLSAAGRVELLPSGDFNVAPEVRIDASAVQGRAGGRLDGQLEDNGVLSLSLGVRLDLDVAHAPAQLDLGIGPRIPVVLRDIQQSLTFNASASGRLVDFLTHNSPRLADDERPARAEDAAC